MVTVATMRNMGNDVLKVDGLDDSGKPITALGWVSATSNYYEPASYGADGHRDPAAEPRAMTAAEISAYGLALLLEQSPPAAAPAAPVELYSDPAAVAQLAAALAPPPAPADEPAPEEAAADAA